MFHRRIPFFYECTWKLTMGLVVKSMKTRCCKISPGSTITMEEDKSLKKPQDNS